MQSPYIHTKTVSGEQPPAISHSVLPATTCILSVCSLLVLGVVIYRQHRKFLRLRQMEMLERIWLLSPYRKSSSS
jgi:hypothetical protein